MKKLSYILAIGLMLFLAGVCSADISAKLNKIVSSPSQAKCQFSINIIEANSGKVIYSKNPQMSLIPASNMKLVTTAAALYYLKSDFIYMTTVGLFDGDLVIRGAGDPLLGDEITDKKYNRKKSWLIDDIAEKLAAKNIKTINNIIVDSTIFDDHRVCPNWPKAQLNRSYACEISGLNYNGNCIDVTAKNVSRKIDIQLEPATHFLTFVNKIQPTSKRNKSSNAIAAYRTNKPNHIIFKGKCRSQSGPFTIAIQRPAVYLGFLIAEKLLEKNIRLNGQLIEKAAVISNDFIKLAEYKTTIADCLTRANKDSFGLAAECLLKTISSNMTGQGSFDGGKNLISRYLTKIGVEPTEFFIDDGSGLSRKNRLSANTITTVLSGIYKGSNRKLFKESLSVGGIDGTAAKHFKDPRYRGKIFGKTGYINGVKSFSGICQSKQGDFIFSIIVNKANGKTRPVINAIVEAIIDN